MLATLGVATVFGLPLIDRAAPTFHFEFPRFGVHHFSDLPGATHQAPEPEFGPSSAAAPSPPAVEVASADKLSDLFVRVGYALDDVRVSGAVPRLFLNSLPDDLTELRVPAERKQLFIKATLPLVLYANEVVAGDRRRVEALKAEVENGFDLAPADVLWTEELARTYRLDGCDFEELLVRLDIIPPSLAIAQAAVESGWGTSRFARLGNALFGQKAFGSEAGEVVLASEARDRQKFRAFNDLFGAVRSYAFNLNSHPAYAEFRARRALLRKEGSPLAGSLLVEPMHRYSERGVAYVRYLEMVIRTNALEAFDDARLHAAPDIGESDSSGI
jgi:Bax protein